MTVPMTPTHAVKGLVFAAALTASGALGTSADAAGCSGSYAVRSGETLSAISRSCGVSVSALIYANPSIQSPRDLRAGLRLAIPNGEMGRTRQVQRLGRTKKIIPVAVIDRRSEGELDGPKRMKVPNEDEIGIDGIEMSPAEAEGRTVEVAALDEDATTTLSYLDYAAESDQFYTSPVPLPRREANNELQVKGTIETGERCALVKTADGEVFGLRGTGFVFPSDQDVEISGKLRASRVCDAEYTIAVSDIKTR